MDCLVSHTGTHAIYSTINIVNLTHLYQTIRPTTEVVKTKTKKLLGTWWWIPLSFLSFKCIMWRSTFSPNYQLLVAETLLFMWSKVLGVRVFVYSAMRPKFEIYCDWWELPSVVCEKGRSCWRMRVCLCCALWAIQQSSSCAVVPSLLLLSPQDDTRPNQVSVRTTKYTK